MATADWEFRAWVVISLKNDINDEKWVRLSKPSRTIKAIQHLLLRVGPTQVQAESSDLALENDGHIAALCRYLLPTQSFDLRAVDELEGDFFILLVGTGTDDKQPEPKEGDRYSLFDMLRRRKGVISIQIPHVAATSNWNVQKAVECLGGGKQVPGRLSGQLRQQLSYLEDKAASLLAAKRKLGEVEKAKAKETKTGQQIWKAITSSVHAGSLKDDWDRWEQQGKEVDEMNRLSHKHSIIQQDWIPHLKKTQEYLSEFLGVAPWTKEMGPDFSGKFQADAAMRLDLNSILEVSSAAMGNKRTLDLDSETDMGSVAAGTNKRKKLEKEKQAEALAGLIARGVMTS